MVMGWRLLPYFTGMMQPLSIFRIPYARHYKPRLVQLFFTTFFTAVHIVVGLILQTIYVLNKEILQFLGLKSAVYNQERVIMARLRHLQA